MRKAIRVIKIFFISLTLTYLSYGILINIFTGEQQILVPVVNAKKENWDPMSYWYYPWGKSGVHKGIDIFMPKGTNVIAPTNSFIIETGYSKNGGNYIYSIGYDLKIYYFAHLDRIHHIPSRFVKSGTLIGFVGDSGNAKGKTPHLHFSIFCFAPIFKYYDKFEVVKPLQKMFFLKPQKFMKYKRT